MSNFNLYIIILNTHINTLTNHLGKDNKKTVNEAEHTYIQAKYNLGTHLLSIRVKN